MACREWTFTPKGVCAQRIDIRLDGECRIVSVVFEDGCSGNTQGVARLARGRDALEVAECLAGIRCGEKETSCPDQLAGALRAAVKSIRA